MRILSWILRCLAIFWLSNGPFGLVKKGDVPTRGLMSSSYEDPELDTEATFWLSNEPLGLT